jgi:hypothetical protein
VSRRSRRTRWVGGVAAFSEVNRIGRSRFGPGRKASTAAVESVTHATIDISQTTYSFHHSILLASQIHTPVAQLCHQHTSQAHPAPSIASSSYPPYAHQPRYLFFTHQHLHPPYRGHHNRQVWPHTHQFAQRHSRRTRNATHCPTTTSSTPPLTPAA